MVSIKVLPPSFDNDVLKLETYLQNNTLTLKDFKELLNLYKAGISYYNNREETKKNVFVSKYKYVLSAPYVVNMMKQSTSRYLFLSLVSQRGGIHTKDLKHNWQKPKQIMKWKKQYKNILANSKYWNVA